METKITQTGVSKTILEAQADVKSVCPTLPGSSGFKNIKQFLFIFLVIVVVATAMLFYYFRNQTVKNNKTVTQKQPKEVQVVSGPTIENNRAILKAKSKVVFPEIVLKQDGSIKILPDFLQKFIGDFAEVVKVQTLTYKGGQVGFLVEYSMEGTLLNIDRQILTGLLKQKVDMLYASRATLFAIKDFKLGDSIFQLTESVGDTDVIKIIIQSINK